MCVPVESLLVSMPATKDHVKSRNTTGYTWLFGMQEGTKAWRETCGPFCRYASVLVG